MIQCYDTIVLCLEGGHNVEFSEAQGLIFRAYDYRGAKRHIKQKIH